MLRAIKLVVPILLLALGAQADTIVLKSGRRITATNVVEEGDRVSYETPAGRMSLKKELVERIERGGTSTWATGSSGKDITVEPPKMVPLTGAEEVVKAAVHDGAVDRSYLAKLENDAHAGTAGAVSRLTLAHYTAAQFELRRGNSDQALDHYRRGLTFAPENSVLLMHISYLHLRRGEYNAALDYLERARRVEPNSADVAKLTGWAYYGSNRIEQAVKEWQRALTLRRDPDVEQALEKAKRDQEAEREFREGETRHFSLRYHGGAAPELAKEILRALEMHFRTLESELNFTPSDSIAVILYTEQAFADVTRAPAWVGALNDGRIRIPVQGLVSVTPELSRTLMHELTHSFVHLKTRSRAPWWVHDGLAQWMEGKRSDEAASALVAIYERKEHIPLKVLEGSVLQLPGNAVSYAYAWSLATVEYVARVHGMRDVERLLDRITTESSVEAALRSTFHMDYEEFEAEVVRYLKRTYTR